MNFLKQGMKNHPEVRWLILAIAISMLFMACVLTVFGGYMIFFESSIFAKILGVVIIYAAADLVCSVFGKPLVKAGPLAKAGYPHIPDLDCTCDRRNPCDKCKERMS